MFALLFFIADVTLSGTDSKFLPISKTVFSVWYILRDTLATCMSKKKINREEDEKI